MQANPAYVSFQVLDHMEDGVTSRVHRQIGTLKDIANVADASILKTLVTLRAIEHQKVKRATFTFLKQQYAGDIHPAPPGGGGGTGSGPGRPSRGRPAGGP